MKTEVYYLIKNKKATIEQLKSMFNLDEFLIEEIMEISPTEERIIYDADGKRFKINGLPVFLYDKFKTVK